MTGILLDTNALIWALDDSPRLSPAARRLIIDKSFSKLVSAASIWELAIKTGLGKLPLSIPLSSVLEVLKAKRVRTLSIDGSLAIAVARLPLMPKHRDPFDRLIIAQALELNVGVVSSDAAFDAYGVHRIW